LETRDEERAKWRGWNANDDSNGEGGHPLLVGNVNDNGDGGGELPSLGERSDGQREHSSRASQLCSFVFVLIFVLNSIACT